MGSKNCVCVCRQYVRRVGSSSIVEKGVCLALLSMHEEYVMVSVYCSGLPDNRKSYRVYVCELVVYLSL